MTCQCPSNEKAFILYFPRGSKGGRRVATHALLRKQERKETMQNNQGETELPRDQMMVSPKRYMNSGPQITERLEKFFSVIGQQGVLRFDQAQCYLGRMTPDPGKMKQPGIMSAERTRKILRPWLKEEVILYRTFFYGQKGCIWLTAKDSTPPHIPDAELISANGNSVIGIECELTVRSEKRLEEIVIDLAGNKRYSAIWYFGPESVYRAVKKAVDKLPPEHRKRFVCYTLQGDPYTESGA